jgi:hypothetical protein
MEVEELHVEMTGVVTRTGTDLKRGIWERGAVAGA